MVPEMGLKGCFGEEIREWQDASLTVPVMWQQSRGEEKAGKVSEGFGSQIGGPGLTAKGFIVIERHLKSMKSRDVGVHYEWDLDCGHLSSQT